MILADIHSHTYYAHGEDDTAAMYAAAQKTPLRWFGFSEHSPLPPGYSCRLYRNGDLSAVFPLYAEEVLALKRTSTAPAVLFGMELDWIPAHKDFMTKLTTAYPFDYIIGGLHFLTKDQAVASPYGWDCGEAEHFARIEHYYSLIGDMGASGLVDVVAHPDFIKVRCFESFHRWLTLPRSQDVLSAALLRLRERGTVLEVSSAGLRKEFNEPYPARPIMRLAADLGLEISFGSDAHSTADTAAGFDELADYAREFGYTQHVIFEGRNKRHLDF